MKNWRFLLGILFAVGIPLLCYLFVRLTAGDGHVTMPGHYSGVDSVKPGKYRGKAMNDTFWRSVQNFDFVNQLNDTVNIFKDSNMDRKIVVLNFFFTTCKTTCPKLNGNFNFFQSRFKKKNNDSFLHFVSITVDPVGDSIAALRAYANTIGANHDKWWFCKLLNYPINQYMFKHMHLPDIQAQDTLNNNVNHSNVFVVVDKERIIRGYYNALDTNEIRRCGDDISKIILEKKKPHFSNNK